MTGTFEIEGQQFMASMADLTSLFRRRCHSSLAAKHRQKWTACGEKLSAGGAVQQCGWLKDSFGVWWKIIPTALGKMLSDPNPMKSKNVMKAMLPMKNRATPRSCHATQFICQIRKLR